MELNCSIPKYPVVHELPTTKHIPRTYLKFFTTSRHGSHGCILQGKLAPRILGSRIQQGHLPTTVPASNLAFLLHELCRCSVWRRMVTYYFDCADVVAHLPPTCFHPRSNPCVHVWLRRLGLEPVGMALPGLPCTDKSAFAEVRAWSLRNVCGIRDCIPALPCGNDPSHGIFLPMYSQARRIEFHALMSLRG